MRESISFSGVFPLQAWIPAFARMTKLEHFIFCHVQRLFAGSAGQMIYNFAEWPS